MKTILTMSALLLLISAPAMAGSGYDGCIKEEKALKAREAGDCHGLKYLLNPSACYATQKALREYTSTGKCRSIGSAEGVDFTAKPVMPERKASSSTRTCPVKEAWFTMMTRFEITQLCAMWQ